MKKVPLFLIAGVAAFVLLQLIRPGIPSKPAAAEVQAPPEVRRVLEKDCYSCHSDERKLAWFDEVVPAYWLVRKDVLMARGHLNFSTLGAKPAATQRAALFESVNMIQLGAMPLPAFRNLHPEARVTPEDMTILKNYLAPWKTVPAPAAPITRRNPVALDQVAPAPGGLAFDPGFAGWKLISTTDRGDNNSFRIILGNDIAIKAIREGRLSPWPDGAKIAKIAWFQEAWPDGLLWPGNFWQVELMAKDHARYASTDGWGWGRWRGLDLKPYGQNAGAVSECTGCHQPVRGNDYVYTQPITAASIRGEEITNSRAAALPASLPYQPLSWSPITMYVDSHRHTMAVLFGNDAAMRTIHPRGAIPQSPQYPAGAVLALVTWAQREDPHWFGARIPDMPLSVEFVRIGASNGYRRFAGAGLTETFLSTQEAKERMHFLSSLPPAQLP